MLSASRRQCSRVLNLSEDDAPILVNFLDEVPSCRISPLSRPSHSPVTKPRSERPCGDYKTHGEELFVFSGRSLQSLSTGHPATTPSARSSTTWVSSKPTGSLQRFLKSPSPRKSRSYFHSRIGTKQEYSLLYRVDPWKNTSLS